VLSWNVFEAIKWITRCFPSRSSRWITQRIILFNSIFKSSEIQNSSKKLQHFIEEYLEPDGIFMIRMIANNASDFVATDLIKELWKRHYKNYKTKFINEPQDFDGIEMCEDPGIIIEPVQAKTQNHDEIRSRLINRNAVNSFELSKQFPSHQSEDNQLNNQLTHQPQQVLQIQNTNLVQDENIPFIITEQLINENNMRRRENQNHHSTKI
jgi:hypothetical protein